MGIKKQGLLWFLLFLIGAGIGGGLYFSKPKDGKAPETVRPEPGLVERSLLLRGRLEPRVEVELKNRIAGRLHGDGPTLGAAVARGGQLLSLEADPGFVTQVREARGMYGEAERDLQRAGRVGVFAPLSGTIGRVLSAEGRVVRAGEPLLLMNLPEGAGKGEQTVRAPRDGQVQKILVQAGKAVAPEDPLPLLYLAPSQPERDALGREAGELLRRFIHAGSVLEQLEQQAGRNFRTEGETVETVFLHSPVEGVVGWRSPKLFSGSWLAEGEPVLKISSQERIIVCQVHEVDYPKIGEGQKVEVGFDSFPDLRLPGRLLEKERVPHRAVFDQYSEYVVRFALAEIPAELVDGMSANLSVTLLAEQAPLTLPLSALIEDKAGDSLVIREGEKLRRLAVTVGRVGDKRLAIEAGLNGHEAVLLHPDRLPRLPPLEKAPGMADRAGK